MLYFTFIFLIFSLNGREKKANLQIDIECDLNLKFPDEMGFAKDENLPIESEEERGNIDITFQNQDSNKSNLPLNPALDNFDWVVSEQSINKIEIKTSIKLDHLSNKDYKLQNAIQNKDSEKSFSEVSSDSKKSQSPSQQNAFYESKEKKTSTKSLENPVQNVKIRNINVSFYFLNLYR